MTGVAAIVVVVLSLPFLFVLARMPVLRRLALRNAIRRPREAVLVVLGSLLGAAIITGSAVVGDAMDASIRQVARTHLGPIDELVTVQGPAEQRLLAEALAPLVAGGQVDGVLPLATIDAAVTSTGPDAVAAPRTQVLGLDFQQASRFGADPRASGVSGPEPGLGHAAIGVDLARLLGVEPGDQIDVHAYGTQVTLAVDRLLPRRGVAGFWLGAEQDARNVLVSLRTFDVIRSGAGAGRPPVWRVAVSNEGGVEPGAALTADVTERIDATAAQEGLEAQVYAAKQTLLDTAEEAGTAFRSMFTAMGSFGVLAGLLLLVNLFVMLAAERKTELGMARAVGMRRAHLVGAFATEGWLYALVATTLGVAAGVGLGAVLVALSSRIFASEHNQMELSLSLRAGSLAQAFAIGFVVALATIVGTSLRVSRLNIIRAIRDIPEPPRASRRRRAVVLGTLAVATGVAITLQGWPSRNGFALLLGPALAVVGVSLLTGRLVSSSTSHSLAALAVVVWGSLLFALVPESTKGADVMLYVVQGIVLTAAAVTLLAYQQARVSAVLRRLTGGRSLSLRLGLAYPLARRSRTGLTVAMYALVVFILTFITSLAHMIDGEVATATTNAAGGYDAIVTSSSSSPVDPARIGQLGGVVSVAPLARTTAFFGVGDDEPDAPWAMSAFDARLLAGGPPRLEDRGSYATDRDAWNAVLHDPSLAIVDPVFLQSGGGPADYVAEPGSRITIRDPVSGRSRRLTVAALGPTDYYVNNGVFYSLEGARELFGDRLPLDRIYVGLASGVDADAFATRVQSEFLANGAEAYSIESIMDEGFTMTRQIFQLFQGYLAMGLIVGILGTAVVMIRAVRERRRQIGTLRALGFPSRRVGRSFAIETAFVAAEGTVIGCVLALVTIYDIVALSDSFGEMTFSVPALELAVLLLGTVAASLAATVWPAVSASRIRPAVALRMTD